MVDNCPTETENHDSTPEISRNSDDSIYNRILKSLKTPKNHAETDAQETEVIVKTKVVKYNLRPNLLRLIQLIT